MATETKGFVVSPGRISFWLGLAALASVAYAGVTAWNSQTFATESNTKDIVQIHSQQDKLADQIDNLNKSVNNLAVAVEGLRVAIAK